jgi:hypothetical protein
MQEPMCDYCENEAVSLEVISMHGSEELDNYEFYVCQDHRGMKHLEEDVKKQRRSTPPDTLP